MIRENREAMRQLEMPVLRKDGALLDAIIVGCGIHDSNGNLIGLSTIIRDVASCKRAERETALLAAIVNASKRRHYRIFEGPRNHQLDSGCGARLWLFGQGGDRARV